MMRSALLALGMSVALLGCGGRSGLLSPSGPAQPDGARRDSGAADAAPRDGTGRDRSLPRDLAPWSPCAEKFAFLEQSLPQGMAICRAIQGQIYDQCKAPQLCGVGWHLCTAAEYRQRFGPSASAPETELSWIAGCVRSGGPPHAPTNQVCAQCPTQVVPLATVGWGCWQDVAQGVQRTHVGVTSHPECFRIGVNTDATAAFWAASRPDYLLRQAFCCRNP